MGKSHHQGYWSTWADIILTYLRGQKETHRIVSSPTKGNGGNGIHRHFWLPVHVCSSTHVGKKNYDWILMINHEGLEGFPTLLLCCKHRYPESVIVFVRTWNLNLLVQVEGNSSELVEVNIAPPIEAIWTTGQWGHIHQMPLPNSVEESTEWFSGNVCFSSKGNQIVANGIYSCCLLIKTKCWNRSNLVRLCLFQNMVFIMLQKVAFGRQEMQRAAGKCCIQEYRLFLLG